MRTSISNMSNKKITQRYRFFVFFGPWQQRRKTIFPRRPTCYSSKATSTNLLHAFIQVACENWNKPNTDNRWRGYGYNNCKKIMKNTRFTWLSRKKGPWNVSTLIFFLVNIKVIPQKFKSRPLAEWVFLQTKKKQQSMLHCTVLFVVSLDYKTEPKLNIHQNKQDLFFVSAVYKLSSKGSSQQVNVQMWKKDRGC